MSDIEYLSDTVSFARDGAVATLCINRPEQRNALNHSVLAGLRAGFAVFEADANLRVLILTATGDKAFCAGMDLKEYFREVDSQPEIVQERIRRDSCRWQWQLLRMYSKPTIAMVNGWCFGGGFSPLARGTPNGNSL